MPASLFLSVCVCVALASLVTVAAFEFKPQWKHAHHRHLQQQQSRSHSVSVTGTHVNRRHDHADRKYEDVNKKGEKYSYAAAYGVEPEYHPINLWQATMNVIDYHAAGNYDAQIQNVLVDALEYVTTQPPPANNSLWVFDIDETSLSGYDEMLSIGFGFVPKLNHDWIMSASAPAINQTLAFYQQLLKLGYNVLFLTGRKDTELNATITNLMDVGYASFVDVIVRSPAEYNLTAQAFKTAHRTQLSEQGGWSIEGCIGDQYSDITGEYTGFKVKLPNYIYFLA